MEEMIVDLPMIIGIVDMVEETEAEIEVVTEEVIETGVGITAERGQGIGVSQVSNMRIADVCFYLYLFQMLIFMHFIFCCVMYLFGCFALTDGRHEDRDDR